MGLKRGTVVLEEYNENNLVKEEKKGLTEIKLRDIEPNRSQPRKMFDEDKINELAESIKENGLVQPIIVSKSGESCTYSTALFIQSSCCFGVPLKKSLLLNLWNI